MRRARRFAHDDITHDNDVMTHLIQLNCIIKHPPWRHDLVCDVIKLLSGDQGNGAAWIFNLSCAKTNKVVLLKRVADFAHFRQGDWLHMLNFSTLKPSCEAWEHFPIYARPTWLPWKPMGPLTLCTCPPPSLQVWCSPACKHQRSRPTKFSYDFLGKCGLKACYSRFHDNALGTSWRQYFFYHPRPKTHPLEKTPSKSDQNSDIRVLYKRC